MTRTRKYLIAASVAAALAAGVPSVANALGAPAASPARTTQVASAHASSSHVLAHSGGLARVVSSGQRVSIGGGVTIWMTKSAMYTNVPGGEPRDRTWFTPKVDGGQKSGINLQLRRVDGKSFVAGAYLNRGAAGKVELTTTTGTVLTGHVLQLAGDTTWGAFYFDPSSALPINKAHGILTNHGIHKITVYNTAGHVITSTTLPKGF